MQFLESNRTDKQVGKGRSCVAGTVLDYSGQEGTRKKDNWLADLGEGKKSQMMLWDGKREGLGGTPGIRRGGRVEKGLAIQRKRKPTFPKIGYNLQTIPGTKKGYLSVKLLKKGG